MFGAGDKAQRAQKESASVHKLEADAHDVASRLPDLMIEAKRIATTVAHGIHGRRRSGPGETFWQFRQYEPNDSATQIDWRRTASSTHVFVREREWEAAHTFSLWPDLSPSMEFKSKLSAITKRERAIVLMLATAEILVRSGERVALLGLTRPTASRNATTRLAEHIAGHAKHDLLLSGLPPNIHLPSYSGVILFSDFLDPIPKIAERIHVLASENTTGHLVQILDPAEETLPYEGRVEFIAPESDDRWLADRAETLRTDYVTRLNNHRADLREVTDRLGWSFMTHHTDRPATEPLLSLIMHLQGTPGFATQQFKTNQVGTSA